MKLKRRRIAKWKWIGLAASVALTVTFAVSLFSLVSYTNRAAHFVVSGGAIVVGVDYAPEQFGWVARRSPTEGGLHSLDRNQRVMHFFWESGEIPEPETVRFD